MGAAAALARAGNRILSLFAVILILLMLLYGGYSLWDSYLVGNAAFLKSDLLKYKPAVDSSGDNYTLAELMAINPDTRGWLTIDGTHIDYPVVQGEDDLEYINKDIFGEFALSGAIFLSCQNSPDFTDSYNLIYGHHMDNGGMFGDVTEFVDADYFDSHTAGTLYLEQETYVVELFACMEVDAYDRLIYSPGEQCDMTALLDYMKNSATQYRDIGVSTGDRIIGCSTCVDAVTNGRVVLFGRLCGED